MELSKSYLTELIYQVNGAAIEVHQEMGPGLLESVYHKFMKYELQLRGISFESELWVPMYYKGVEVNSNLRCDLFVEGVLPVELKAVEMILGIHKMQLMTYMKLLNAPIGLLINFNVTNIFYNGQKTMVNELYRSLPE
ncbi:MAG: GxxExxY protein [Bacteroidota bacterium]